MTRKELTAIRLELRKAKSFATIALRELSGLKPSAAPGLTERYEEVKEGAELAAILLDKIGYHAARDHGKAYSEFAVDEKGGITASA